MDPAVDHEADGRETTMRFSAATEPVVLDPSVSTLADFGAFVKTS